MSSEQRPLGVSQNKAVTRLMQVCAAPHGNPRDRHPLLRSIRNENREVVPLFQQSDDLDSATGKAPRPITQSIDIDVEILAPESGPDLLCFGNADESDSLPDGAMERLSSRGGNCARAGCATGEQRGQQTEGKCSDFHKQFTF
jgi:hypothetical protein